MVMGINDVFMIVMILSVIVFVLVFFICKILLKEDIIINCVKKVS